MPRRSVPSGHIYSVFVDSVTAEGTLATEHIYFGNSKFAAQVKLAQAITDNPHAYQIDLRIVRDRDRKSTRLNSSHANISYAVFCLKKKKKKTCVDENVE